MGVIINKRFLAVWHALVQWEEDNLQTSDTIFRTREDVMLCFFYAIFQIRLGNEPILELYERDWDLWALDIMLEVYQQLGINNIHSIVKQQDRFDIVDDYVPTYMQITDWENTCRWKTYLKHMRYFLEDD